MAKTFRGTTSLPTSVSGNSYRPNIQFVVTASALPLTHTNNYVENYSFETYTGCPAGFYGNVTSVTGWGRPSTGTSDYYNVCYVQAADPISYAEADANGNWIGNQTPATGNGYMGSYAKYTGNREYITTKLNRTLRAGVTYTVSMKVSLADKSKYASFQMGLYLSGDITDIDNGSALSAFTPQVTNNMAIPLFNKAAWQTITGSFVATGNERYLIVGSFLTDAGTSLFNLNDGGTYSNPYYYIDDVCVIAPGGNCAGVLPVELISFKGKLINNEVKLQWSTATEKNNNYFTIERSLDGYNFEEVVEVRGAGNSLSQLNYQEMDRNPVYGAVNYYRLKQTDFNGDFEYSKVVPIRNGEELSNKGFTLFPNPVKDKLSLEIDPELDEDDYQVRIISPLGQIIDGSIVKASEGGGVLVYDLSAVKAGFYFVEVANMATQQTYVQQFAHY